MASGSSRIFDVPAGMVRSQSNTVILAGMPRGQHKVLIELVDPEGNVFTGQTVTFTTRGTA
jgi:hypothetical protein